MGGVPGRHVDKQGLLRTGGILMGIEFDEQLQSRLLAFQKAHGLAEDGTVGAKTWGKLVENAYVGSADPYASHTPAVGNAMADTVDPGHPVAALAGFTPNVEHSKAKTGPAKTGPPKAQATVSEPDRLLVLRIAGELGLIEIERSLNTLRSLMPERFLEFGHARRGFVAGATGFPLVPPTDPQDLAEWQRGEDVAAVMAAAELAAGAAPIGPGGPGHVLAPAGACHAPVPAARPVPRPAMPATPPRYETRETKPGSPAANKAVSPAPAAGVALPSPPPPDAAKRDKIARNPSNKLTPSKAPPGETPQQADARTKAATAELEKSGGQVNRIVGETQLHHLASNKSPNSPAAQESIQILDNARTDPSQRDLLTAPENLVRVEDHGDAHGENYHELVRNRLKNAVAGKSPHTPAYREAVLAALHQMKIDVQTKGTMINLLTIKVSKGGVR